MKLITIINAVPAMQRLCAERIDIAAAYEIHKRLPVLDKCIGFFNAEREKITTVYEGREAETKLRELFEFNTEYDKPPIPLKVKPGFSLSVNDISALAEFIKFEEE